MRCISNINSNRKCAVILAGFVCAMVLSSPFSFGILYYELLVYYKESRQLTSLVVSLVTGVMYAAGMFVSPLVTRFGTRLVIIVGSLVVITASIISFFATGILYLIFSFGFLFGLGICMINIGSNVAVAQQFGQRNDIAFSVVQLGGNLGGLLTIQLHSRLVKKYGVQGCMLVTGAIFFHTCVAGIVLSSPRSSQNESSDTQEIVERHKTLLDNDYLDLLRKPLYIAWIFLLIICNGAVQSVYLNLVDYVAYEGFSEDKGTIMISIIYFIGIPARLLYGFASAQSGRYKFHLSVFVFAVSGLCSILFGMVENVSEFYAVSVLFGCAACGAVTSMSIITTHLSEESNREQAFGLMSTVVGICYSVTGPFIGWIIDVTGSYRWAFIISGLMSIVASFITLAVIIVIQIRQSSAYIPAPSDIARRPPRYRDYGMPTGS